jgi:hypothetical protein
MTASNAIPTIRASAKSDIPEWAALERKLIDIVNKASVEFADRYTNEDKTLIWRDRWPGMDGSDDPYEGFMNLTMHYILGGAKELDTIAREVWDAITWQWTEYGQIVNEFDGGYDWMHHGEALLGFYWFGLANPHVLKDRQRTKKFAALYNGENSAVSNWDPELKIIRSPITGSRGPNHNQTEEDWETHREILENYLPPFEDLPGVDPYQMKAPWLDNQMYSLIIKKINERIAKGDVPVNLTSTGLMTHAFMYEGEAKYKEWVLEYLQAWVDRTALNNGIIPDNIGLDGTIGQYNDGKWWGGYYGWRWPHGSMTILEPLVVAGSNAALLTNGDFSHLDLVRSQMDMLWELRQEIDGQWKTPNRHFDAGWRDFRVQNAIHPILLWNLTQSAEDAQRVERGWVRENETISTQGYIEGSARPQHTAAWYHYIKGRNSEYPVQILKNNLEAIDFQIERFRSEAWNPYTMDHYREAMSIHDWQIIQPAILEALTHLTLGGPMVSYHGGHLHVAVRYFDVAQKRPGLPEDVSALVEKISATSVELVLMNTSIDSSRALIIQGGAFGEHQIMQAQDKKSGVVSKVNGKYLQVDLEPGSEISLELTVDRFANLPSYQTPFIPTQGQMDIPSTITGRRFG